MIFLDLINQNIFNTLSLSNNAYFQLRQLFMMNDKISIFQSDKLFLFNYTLNEFLILFEVLSDDKLIVYKEVIENSTSLLKNIILEVLDKNNLKFEELLDESEVNVELVSDFIDAITIDYFHFTVLIDDHKINIGEVKKLLLENIITKKYKAFGSKIFSDMHNVQFYLGYT